MLEQAPAAQRGQITQRFNDLGTSAAGAYALVDYVNFKGEGVLPTERYRGQGWGLLQVLQTMQGSSAADFCPSRGNGPATPGGEFAAGTWRSALASRLVESDSFLYERMSVYPILIRLCLIAALIFVGAQPSLPQQIRRSRSPTPPPMGARAPAQPMRTAAQPMRKPAELIHRQDPININQALLAKASPDDVHVIVSLPKQRAYLMTGEQVIIDSPISSGKRGHESPHGKFNVMEKDQNHHSSLYGDFRDSKGRVVRAGVSARIDSAPSGRILPARR